MFSARLERHWRFHRLAILVAATLFAVGIALIVVWGVRTSSMLAAVDADRTTNNSRMLIAFLGLIVLCLIAYGAVRAFGRFE
jgi:hypothetical protein